MQLFLLSLKVLYAVDEFNGLFATTSIRNKDNEFVCYSALLWIHLFKLGVARLMSNLAIFWSPQHGKRSKGRPRCRYTDLLVEDFGLHLEEILNGRSTEVEGSCYANLRWQIDLMMMQNYATLFHMNCPTFLFSHIIFIFIGFLFVYSFDHLIISIIHMLFLL